MNYAEINVNDSQTIIPLNPKNFKTGSIGFNGIGKLSCKGGKRYQIIINVVEIGSKKKEV